MNRIVTMIGAIALVGCSRTITDINRPPDTVRVGQQTYWLVKAPQLMGVLKGHQLVDDPCLDTSLCTNRFSSDGHSLERTGDAVPLVFGDYTVPGDRFCETIEKSWTSCKALFRADDGTYATMTFDGEWRNPVAVHVTPFMRKP